jgi:hypothetical protein
MHNFLRHSYVSRVIRHPVQKKIMNGTPLLINKEHTFYFAILA